MRYDAPQIGDVVRSMAGHDKGRLFAVVGLDGSGYALLADGRTRTLEKPKKKKLRHIRPPGRLPASCETARALRRALSAIQAGVEGAEAPDGQA